MKKTIFIVVAVLSAAMLLIGILTARAPAPTPSIEHDDRCLAVPQLCQYPELPTGCEATAAAMVLQYYGCDVDAATVATWLPCDSLYYEGEQLCGPDPRQSFVGDPFSDEGYGCFAPVIVEAVRRSGLPLCAKTIVGQTLDSLCTTYVDNGMPCLVWVTMEMREPTAGTTWTLSDGSRYTWIAGEHCMVLVGYDEEQFYFNDPRAGGTVAYERALSERRFEQMDSQAVCLFR